MAKIAIHTQPDDESCGPTCLHAIYTYYQHAVSLSELVQAVERSYSGGTLACLLGKHALTNQFKTTIYVNNVSIFDPSWFINGYASNELLTLKLSAQLRYKRAKNITQVSRGYLSYLKMGGEIQFKTLNLALLNHYFKQNIPIITGLSATYLYNCAREYFTNNGVSVFDDIQGKPCGHFVVLCDYDDNQQLVTIADPHRENPISQDNHYRVKIDRLINAIMLGVLTYDANLLIIQPREQHEDHHSYG